MSVFDQITRLIRRAVPVPGVPEAPDEDHRVLTLFRNRAELKKAYGGLQDELYRLKDRVKQQEGATARVQEMLGGLESRLGVVDTAYPALVFYQLRALWQRGREILEQFSADLSAQQEERERRALLAEFNRRQTVRRQTLDRNLSAAVDLHTATQQAVAELNTRQASLTRFWHYFKRREVEKRLVAAREVAQQAAVALENARAAGRALAEEPVPDFPGLSVDARRAINNAVIAYAEVLCLRLADTPLVMMAREATGRREPVDEYGDRKECESLIALIARARTQLDSRASVAQEVKERSEQLRQVARYRNPVDTAPTSESVGLGEDVMLGGRRLEPTAAARLPNVLAEDTWDLFRVLLR